MSDLRFVCLGVGNAFSRRWYSSAVAVESGGIWLLVDCPHPIRKILGEAGAAAGVPDLDVGRFAGVALTHLHADHASGVEGFGFYHRYVLQRRAILLGHPALLAALEAGTADLLATPGQPRPSMGDSFDLIALDEAQATEFGPFRIECRPTTHSVPTWAMRIRAGGRCLGLSADTGYDPGLIDWLAETDLVVHEAGKAAPHTPYERLAALPEPLRRKMRLTHYPDDFDAESSAIEPLVPGRSYEV